MGAGGSWPRHPRGPAPHGPGQPVGRTGSPLTVRDEMRRSVQEELRGRLQGVLGLAEDPGLVCMGLDTDYQLRAVQATGRRWARPVDGGQAGSLPPQPSPWDPPPQWDSALSSPQASCGWSRSFRMWIVGSDQGGLLTPDAGARTGGSGHMHVGEALSSGP